MASKCQWYLIAREYFPLPEEFNEREYAKLPQGNFVYRFPRNLFAQLGIRLSKKQFDNALEQLDELSRKIVLLRFKDALSYKDVARESGIYYRQVQEIIFKTLDDIKKISFSDQDSILALDLEKRYLTPLWNRGIYEISELINAFENNVSVGSLGRETKKQVLEALKAKTGYVKKEDNPVKILRFRSGLTVEEFCNKYEIPESKLKSWEENRSIPPSYVLNLLKRVVEMDFKE